MHINPRLAYCFPDQEEIYMRLYIYIYTYLHTLSTATMLGATRNKRLVESRAFMRAHFVLSGREWETKELAE